jgi:DNA-binding transcriptional ArsR family regulator
MFLNVKARAEVSRTCMSESGEQKPAKTLPAERRTKGMVDAELKGNTLRVYVYALKKRRVGVREVQRALLMSNPSLAQYHLNKLRELGLVSEDNGEYEVVGEVKVDVMRDFLRLGSLIVPRFIFYAVIFTVFAAYLTFAGSPYYTLVPVLAWFTAVLAAAAAAFWYEAARAWRSVPSP